MASSVLEPSPVCTPQNTDSSLDTIESPGKVEIFSELQSSRSTRRLEQIAELRARGVGEHIGLPQLVVCGDQSAGKSSVLEGITGIPFPRNDGLCTKFATEIILQQSLQELSIVATILPAASRSDKSKDTIRKFRRELKAFSELPVTITDAGTLMGIRGFGDILLGPAFAEDVLRIDVLGPLGLHLSVVDLPGLISVPNEEQTEDDIDIVHRLVDSYVKSPRTIILAVVQAGNDIANQTIIRKSRAHDKSGKRTVGIITKPDLINKGTQSRIALLAKNQDSTKLKLGYFLLKNPAPEELEDGITFEQRVRNETQYFQTALWKEQNLDASRTGILSLRSYLQSLLDQHIESELPKVRTEIEGLLAKTTDEVASLGLERPAAPQCRVYLSRLATQFHSLTTSALNGTYHEADACFFYADQLEDSTRLRALAHIWNTEFSDVMRERGEKRKVVETQEADSADEESDDESEICISNPQLLVSSSAMKTWVREIYVKTRGKELPGNYNHVLLSELFSIQSSRWAQISKKHLDRVADNMALFVQNALEYIIVDEAVRAEIADLAGATLSFHKREAERELEKIIEDETQHPMTYNHYFTDNVQQARLRSTHRLIQMAMAETKDKDFQGKLHVSNNLVDADRLLTSLQNRVIIDMDDQACAEALDGLKAYYKVARKTFVDNVCRQVVERHLFRHLTSIFNPEAIAIMSNEELVRIAAEKPISIRKRKELQELQLQLEKSLQALRK